jgi:HAMP domain-containing protein
VIWIPYVLGAAGVVISSLMGLLLAVLAWLVKFTLATIDKRVDELHERVKAVESKTNTHDTQIATTETLVGELKADIGSLSSKFDAAMNAIRDIVGMLKRGGHTTPPPRPAVRDPRTY